jgi:hypothetical protein
MNPGLNSGLGGANMNSDLAKQMPLLTAAGRMCTTSTAGQQQQQRGMGMASPVPPNVPDKQRAYFMTLLSRVLASKGLVLPPFVTGQPNPNWIPDTGLLKDVQPASDNRPGALRIPNAAPGRAGDIDLFRLWSAVTGAGGMQRVSRCVCSFPVVFCAHQASDHCSWTVGRCRGSSRPTAQGPAWCGLPSVCPACSDILYTHGTSRKAHEGMPSNFSFPAFAHNISAYLPRPRCKPECKPRCKP